MDAIAERILAKIDACREEILETARWLYDHGELGYREQETGAFFVRKMGELGLPVETGLALTGAKARLNPEKAGNASIALLGEMDALRIPSHSHANPATGAAHCCGHHAQLAGVIGAAMALTDPEVAAALDGQVVFFAVPAEEYGEVEYRKELMEQGKIACGGGKCELIRTGAFDDIDLAVSHHLRPLSGVELGSGSHNGFISKVYTIHGRAAHAAAHPEQGVNALSAAALGLQALAFNREAFRDEDCVRVHPILNRGGDLVNVVPETAVAETLIRGRTREAILDAERRTDRSFRAGALAMGAGLTIETMPGYLPGLPQAFPPEIAEAVRDAMGADRVTEGDLARHSGGSTDVGDLQHLMPVFTFHTGGMVSALHSSGFDVVDEENAYLDTARVFALTAYEFLRDGAVLAKREKQRCSPAFPDREAYCRWLDQFRGIREYPAEE